MYGLIYRSTWPGFSFGLFISSLLFMRADDGRLLLAGERANSFMPEFISLTGHDGRHGVNHEPIDEWCCCICAPMDPLELDIFGGDVCSAP